MRSRPPLLPNFPERSSRSSGLRPRRRLVFMRARLRGQGVLDRFGQRRAEDPATADGYFTAQEHDLSQRIRNSARAPVGSTNFVGPYVCRGTPRADALRFMDSFGWHVPDCNSTRSPQPPALHPYSSGTTGVQSASCTAPALVKKYLKEHQLHTDIRPAGFTSRPSGVIECVRRCLERHAGLYDDRHSSDGNALGDFATKSDDLFVRRQNHRPRPMRGLPPPARKPRTSERCINRSRSYPALRFRLDSIKRDVHLARSLAAQISSGSSPAATHTVRCGEGSSVRTLAGFKFRQRGTRPKKRGARARCRAPMPGF